MLKLHNAAARIDPDKIDDMDLLFNLLLKTKISAKPYSLRYKQTIKFHSAHKVLNESTLSCLVSGPETEDLRFRIVRDKAGYLFKLSVGDLNEETLVTMNTALRGVLKKLQQPKPDGFSTKRLDGIYLWGSYPDEEALEYFQEAVDLNQMSSEFRDTCIEWDISAKKFPQ